MSERPAPADGYRHTLRDPGPLLAFAVVALIAVVFVGDAALRSGPVGFLRMSALAVGPLGVLWLVLVHPKLRFDEGGVTITNIARRHHAPWSSISTVRQNVTLALELTDGRTLEANAVTAPRDRGLVMSALTRGRYGLGSAEVHRHADALRAYRDTRSSEPAVPDANATATSSWAAIPLAVVGGLVIVTSVVGLVTAIPV